MWCVWLVGGLGFLLCFGDGETIAVSFTRFSNFLEGVVFVENKVPIRLTDRDLQLFNVIWRFRFCLGRQVQALCSFNGARACDSRLKKLVEAGYLTRKHYLYGVPALYFVTKRVSEVLPLRFYEHKIRVEQILHDITVIDTVIFLCLDNGISLDDVKTAKELHGIDGFGGRKHQPDFVYYDSGLKIAVEIELSPKSKARFMNNVKENYLSYDKQIWVVPGAEPKILNMLDEVKKTYSDIDVISYEVITENARRKRWGDN